MYADLLTCRSSNPCLEMEKKRKKLLKTIHKTAFKINSPIIAGFRDILSVPSDLMRLRFGHHIHICASNKTQNQQMRRRLFLPPLSCTNHPSRYFATRIVCELTQHLAQDVAAVLAVARIPSIVRIQELHERIPFVHRNACEVIIL